MWQSIETAPKDGNRILVWAPREHDPDGGTVFIAEWDTDENNRKPRPWWSYGHTVTEDRRRPPTHWMPLPSLPARSSSGTGTNKYRRLIIDRTTGQSVTADVYDILVAWGVACPATQHAIKKLLMPGQRGGKPARQDLEEALASVQAAIDLHSAVRTTT
jgi:hypothetical protein